MERQLVLQLSFQEEIDLRYLVCAVRRTSDPVAQRPALPQHVFFFCVYSQGLYTFQKMSPRLLVYTKNKRMRHTLAHVANH